MVGKIEPINPKVRTNPLIEAKIKVLEAGQDVRSLLSESELKEFKKVGRAQFLAGLIELRQSLAENENW